MSKEKKELSHAEQNACGWHETICEHVACMEADRERLEELRDEREALADAAEEATEALADYGTVSAEDAEEEAAVDKLNDAATEAQKALKEWDDENGEEFAELVKAVTIEGEETDEETIRERIQESPLSVQVRGDWHSPGEEDDGAAEYEILLSTGGPALRIVGDLDEHCQPTRARLEYQDWGTPWTEYFDMDRDALLKWASVFYFGN